MFEVSALVLLNGGLAVGAEYRKNRIIYLPLLKIALAMSLLPGILYKRESNRRLCRLRQHCRVKRVKRVNLNIFKQVHR